MSATRTYLDYNASAPLRPEARDAVRATLDLAGNAASVHAEGRRLRGLIEDARDNVAALVGAAPSEVVFTSGATESANWVLARNWRTVVFSRIEHPAITEPLFRHPAQLHELALDRDGLVDLAALKQWLEAEGAEGTGYGGLGLLVVQHANNETGVIQPVAEIAALAKAHGLAVLVDAVQTAGRLPIDVNAINADYLIVSSHKIGGPRGTGALVMRGAAGLPPLLRGGGQERGHRAGTENVEAIAGFGAAAAAAARDFDKYAALGQMRDKLEAGLVDVTTDLAVIGQRAPRLANTSLVALRGANAETLVIALDLAGVAASSGAACASGKARRSPVLNALGVDEELSAGAVRFSLGWATKEDDISVAIGAWRKATRSRRGERNVA